MYKMLARRLNNTYEEKVKVPMEDHVDRYFKCKVAHDVKVVKATE